MSDVAELMKRCQRGVGGRNALDEAHDIMAECYGTLGRLESERAALEAENARLVERAGYLVEFAQQMARQQGEPYYQKLAKAALKKWSGL